MSNSDSSSPQSQTGKHRYVFARLFIRIGIFLAILTVLAGLGFVAMQLSQYYAEASAIKYRANDNLAVQTERAAKIYAGTSERLLGTLGIAAFPAQVGVVDIPARAKELLPADSIKKLDGFSGVLQATAQSVGQMKAYHAAELEEGLNALRQTLLAKAAETRQKYQRETAQKNTTQSTAAAPVVSAPARFRIYADDPNQDEQRNRLINTARQYLKDLQEESKSEKNKNDIRKALDYLAKAEALLDLTKPELTPRPQIVPSTEEAAEPASQEALEIRAEEVAQKLQRISELIRQQIYSEWKIDLLLNELQIAVNNEKAKARDAQLGKKALLTRTASSIVLTLLATITAAFILLVAIDFLRAFLNLSNNSDALRQLKNTDNA